MSFNSTYNICNILEMNEIVLDIINLINIYKYITNKIIDYINIFFIPIFNKKVHYLFIEIKLL
jgi:hypothetical protein